MEHIDIQKHVRIYISVFVALAALTIVTVAVSYLDLGFVQGLYGRRRIRDRRRAVGRGTGVLGGAY